MTTSTLLSRVEPAPFEPAYGLLARLAARHGFDDLGLFGAIAAGSAALADEVRRGLKVEVAARLAGEDAVALARRSLTPGPTGSWLLMGEEVDWRRTLAFGADFGKICPQCLADDARTRHGPPECRPHRRSHWDLAAVSCCQTHRAALLRACPCCREPLSTAAARPDLCCCGADLTTAATEAVPAATLLGEAYLLGRIGAGPRRPHALLDGLPFGVAADAMLRVGLAAGRPSGPEFPRNVGPIERAEAMAAGMRVLGRGRQAFRALLDDMAAAVPMDERSPQRVYGNLQKWLRHAGPAFEVLRQELREHAAGNTLTKGATKVFGEEAASGAWTTFGQLSKRCGASVERLGTVGTLTGILDGTVTPQRSTPVPAHVAAKLEEFVASTVGQAEAGRRLGVTRAIFDGLVRFGALERALPTEGTTIPAAFRTQDLDALAARISGGRRLVGQPPKGSATIAAAVRICSRESIEILKAILDGRLAPRGKPDGAGIVETWVDTADVIRALPRTADPHLISVAEAGRRLRVSHPTIAVLKARGNLSAYKGDTAVRTVTGIDAREVSAVLAAHVSTSELASSVRPRTHTKSIHQVLEAAGLLPSIDAPQPLFDRAAAERVVLRWDRSRKAVTAAAASMGGRAALPWPFTAPDHDASGRHVDVTDAEWRVIEPVLPPWREDLRPAMRGTVDGILWRLRTGAGWGAVPPRYGPYMRCVNRFLEWRDDGIWEQVLAAVTRLHGRIEPIELRSVRSREASGRRMSGAIAWKPGRVVPAV